MKIFRRVAFILLILVAFFLIIPFVIPLDETGTSPESLADEDGQFITIDEAIIYYRDVLPDDDPKGTLVLLHGLFGSTNLWRYNIDAWTDADYRVIALDRPGAGLSSKDWNFDYSRENQSEIIIAVLDELDVEQASVMGHSAGANILAQLILDDPERIESAIFVGGALGTGGAPAFVSAIIEFPPVSRWARIITRQVLTRNTIESAVAGFQADATFLNEDDYDTYWRAFQTPLWDAGFIGLARDVRSLAPSALQGVEVPTLIIHGDADTTVNISVSQELDALLLNSQFITYADIGHQPMEEHAEIFNADVITWLDALNTKNP